MRHSCSTEAGSGASCDLVYLKFFEIIAVADTHCEYLFAKADTMLAFELSICFGKV